MQEASGNIHQGFLQEESKDNNGGSYFNSVENVKCNKVAGEIYAFPRITLPKKAIEAATVSSLVSGLNF